MTRRIDVLCVAAAVIAAATAWGYVAVVRSQDSDPAGWVLAVLALAVLGATYAAVRSSPGRLWALAASTVLLGVLGLLAILSVGFPLLVAAGLCLVAALRTLSAPTAPGRS